MPRLNQNDIRCQGIAVKRYNRFFIIRCSLQWSTLLSCLRLSYEREFFLHSFCTWEVWQFLHVRMQRKLFVLKRLLRRLHERLLIGNSATCSCHTGTFVQNSVADFSAHQSCFARLLSLAWEVMGSNPVGDTLNRELKQWRRRLLVLERNQAKHVAPAFHSVVVRVLQNTQNLVISRCFAKDGQGMYKDL